MDAADEAFRPDMAASPHRLIVEAARGDLMAQRALTDGSVKCFQQGNSQALWNALIYGRMAAVHGDPGDIGKLLCLLMIAGHLCDKCGETHFANIYQAEAIARAELVNESGIDVDELLAKSAPGETMLGALERTPPEVMRLAKELRKEIAG